MIRTPLRPLARILEARASGENPDAIERENLRIRHEQMRDASRGRAEGRLLILSVIFFCAFGVIIRALSVGSYNRLFRNALLVGSFFIFGRFWWGH